jgi:hypothetical protein
MVLLKMGPLWTLRKPMVLQDVWVTLALFGVYLVWIRVNRQDPNIAIQRTKELILHNKNTLPGMQWFEHQLKKRYS